MKQNTTEPPLLKGLIIILNLIIYAWVAIILYNTLITPKNPVELNSERNNSEIILVGGNSLKASTPVVHIEPKVLGIMANGLSTDEAILLNKIAECESGWRTDVCNLKYGCRGGQGLFQIIPSTAKTCEKNLGRPINPFNEQDSLDCAIWLLTETSQGHHHWGTPTSWWGSYWCWHTAIP